ncbi:hypothetical protein ACWEQ8_34815, partial [Streptomyces noursei]
MAATDEARDEERRPADGETGTTGEAGEAGEAEERGPSDGERDGGRPGAATAEAKAGAGGRWRVTISSTRPAWQIERSWWASATEVANGFS